MSRPILTVCGLDVKAGNRVLVRGLELEIRPGECVAILGRNGAGKSLTLHALAGLGDSGASPAAGSLSLDGQPLDGLPRRAIARRIGLLPQDLEAGHSETALDTVLVGRHPHLPLWRWERDEDRRLARMRHHFCRQADMNAGCRIGHHAPAEFLFMHWRGRGLGDRRRCGLGGGRLDRVRPDRRQDNRRRRGHRRGGNGSG